MPEIDDYYEPFTFDWASAIGPEMKATPTARPRSLISGQPMDKIVWGPNWEEILGGEFSKRSKDKNWRISNKRNARCWASLPDVSATAVRALPESFVRGLMPLRFDYKREEDGIVLIDQDKCRGWRMCFRLSVQEDLQLEERQGREVHLLLSPHRSRAADRCSETCVGRIRYLGVLLYDADRIQEAASVEHDRDLYQAQLDIFLDPFDPGDRAGAARRRAG